MVIINLVILAELYRNNLFKVQVLLEINLLPYDLLVPMHLQAQRQPGWNWNFDISLLLVLKYLLFVLELALEPNDTFHFDIVLQPCFIQELRMRLVFEDVRILLSLLLPHSDGWLWGHD